MPESLRLSEPTDEILERLCEAFWNYNQVTSREDGITIDDVHRFDVINAVYSGTIDVDGTVYGYIIQDGNWNGTEVLAWGDPEDTGTYNPGKPDPTIFLPIKPVRCMHPTEFFDYLKKINSSEYQDQLTAYCYDRYHDPSLSVRQHYDTWANERGLRIGRVSEL